MRSTDVHWMSFFAGKRVQSAVQNGRKWFTALLLERV